MREPAANEVTHICCLITGDRFYLANDKNKIVWELRFHTTIFFRGQQVKLSQCRNDAAKVERYNANRVVVFIRRTKPFVRRKFVFDVSNYLS